MRKEAAMVEVITSMAKASFPCQAGLSIPSPSKRYLVNVMLCIYRDGAKQACLVRQTRKPPVVVHMLHRVVAAEPVAASEAIERL